MNHTQQGLTKAQLAVQMEAPTPPPPAGFTSPFQSVHEWLTYLCDNNDSKQHNLEYHFSFINSTSGNLLSLEGFTTSHQEENFARRSIAFKPATHQYLALPKEEFESLSQQQVQERLFDQLKDFTESDKFRNSFLSKGDSIRLSYAGEIWSKSQDIE